MGEPWTEDGGRMNVTEQVEIAEGEFFASKYRTARGLRWCASNQITDGGSSVGPVHRVSHRSSCWDFAPRVFHVLSLDQPGCAAHLDAGPTSQQLADSGSFCVMLISGADSLLTTSE